MPLSQPRKGHRKSRQGCYDCKRRKIKCQETLPSCENCIRSNLRCRYLSHSAEVSPHQIVTLHETQVFSLVDMRLFHHYLNGAHPHFPIRNDNIWIVYITPIAHQSEYLMHALLSLSASHLSKVTPTGLTSKAQCHRLQAIKGLNSVLDQPIITGEQADAILATCYALLMQSWWQDDGLQAFIVMTRSCDSVSRHIRSQEVGSLLASESAESRMESMQSRLAKDTPTFNVGCIRDALLSLNALEPLCQQDFEKKLWKTLETCFISLANSPFQAYKSYLSTDKAFIDLGITELEQLLDPQNKISQLLLAHIVALYLVIRPLCCRERKYYTVTMYSIRMKTWIEQIHQNLDEGMKKLCEWPRQLSQFNLEKKLEEYTVVKTTNAQAPRIHGCDF